MSKVQLPMKVPERVFEDKDVLIAFLQLLLDSTRELQKAVEALTP